MPAPLSLPDLQAVCTGTFRERFYKCMQILGVQEVRFLASVGIDPTVLSIRTANQPVVPLIHVEGWHQLFVRDMVVTRALPAWSRFFEPQDLRDALIDPGSTLPVRQACGEKAVFDIVWSLEAQPAVTVTGRTFESTPISGFASDGHDFSIVTPDQPANAPGQGVSERSFEFGYRLARHHFQTTLSAACNQYAWMESFGSLINDVFLKRYLAGMDEENGSR